MMELLRERKYLQFMLLIVVFILMCMLVPATDGNLLWRLPPLLKQFPGTINDAVVFLMEDWWLIDVYDADIKEYEQKPLMRQVTRGIQTINGPGYLVCRGQW